MVVILKPTLKCNIQCKHCYIGDNYTQKNMTEEDLRLVLETIPTKSEVVIHGGEPLLMGVDFYETVLPYYDHKYSIQSNLTLLSERWIKTLKEIFNSRVSSSFDVKGSVRPITSSHWVNKIELLKKNGIYPYVVCVLNKENQDNGQEIYNFFEQQNLSFRLNYIFNAGRGQQNFHFLRAEHEKYAKALIEIFNLWFLSNTKIIVDPLMEIIESMFLNNSLSKCPFTSKCAIYFISINPDGYVLPCGGFEHFNLTYGNIFYDCWEDIMKAPLRQESIKRIWEVPSYCLDCEWLKLCGGGCRLEAMSYYGSIYKPSSMCKELKMIFSYIEYQLDINYYRANEWYQNLIQKKP